MSPFALRAHQDDFDHIFPAAGGVDLAAHREKRTKVIR
jgi:hypothetical protein